MKTPSERHFDQVASELRASEPVAGLWARAYSEANGDMNRSRALYIRYRAEAIAETEVHEARRCQAEVRRRLYEARSLKAKVFGIKVGLSVLMIVGVLLTLLAVSGIVSGITTSDRSILFVAAFFGLLGILAILRARTGFTALK